MKPLTQLQRKTFFMGIRPAAIEVGEDPEAYRLRILKEELGVEHLGEVSRNGGFDKLMSRIWADRGDYERALSYSKGSSVRLVHLIVDAAKKIVAASPDYDGNAYHYIVGVMAQSKMFDTLPGTEPADFVHALGQYKEEQLKRLLVMLNAYLGRIRKREMVELKPSECSILPLVLKGKWYDMIASGEKTEEYRADTPYWHNRFSNWVMNLPFDGHLVIAFSRGYRKPDLFIEACGINIYPNRQHPDWGEPTGSHYVIALKRRVQLIDDMKV